VRVTRATAAVLLGVTAGASVGCSSQRSSAPAPSTAVSPPAPQTRNDPRQYLSSHAAAKTVQLTMLGALGSSNNGFNFDGYGRGELIASVPLGWHVTVQFQNRGSRLTSCAVVTGPRSATLAFPGATVPNPQQGLAPGAKAHFSFTATRTGSYRIASLVPGQADARMYAVLLVTAGGRPSISARPGP
jgi:hypothetical protein